MRSPAELRPFGLTVALVVWCVAVVVGVISSAVYTGHTHQVQALARQVPYLHATRYVLLAVSILLNVFFALMVFLRHSWARIVLFVLFLLAVLGLPGYLVAPSLAMQAKATSVVCLFFQLAVLVALFTGQRQAWFKRIAA